MRMRSFTRCRCGEVYRPVLMPDSVRIDASVAAVDPLPLVPAIRTERKLRWGSPSAASSVRTWSSENFRRG